METEDIIQQLNTQGTSIEGLVSGYAELKKQLDLADLNQEHISLPAKTNLINLIRKYAPEAVIPTKGGYQVQLWGKEQEVFTYTGRAYIRILSKDDGKDITDVYARTVGTAGSGSGTTSVQLYNVTKGQNVLSTVCSIDINEMDNRTAATPFVIGNPLVDADDIIRIDVTSVTGTAPKGLLVSFEVE